MSYRARRYHGPRLKCVTDGCLNPSRSIFTSKRGKCGGCIATARGIHTTGYWCSVAGCPAAVRSAGKCKIHKKDPNAIVTKHDAVRLLIDYGNENPDSGPECPIPGCPVEKHPNAMICQQHMIVGRRFNLTAPRMVEVYGDGTCHACGATRQPGSREHAIDHDHSCCSAHARACGDCVRGILCHGCNVAIGYAQDSPALLRSLADYLESRSLALAA